MKRHFNIYPFTIYFITTCLLSFYFSKTATSQESSDSALTFFKLGAEVHYGFIVPHRPSMQYVISEPVRGADLLVFKRTGGDRMWHRYYRKPQIGAGLHYMNLGNPEWFGHAFAAYITTGFFFKERPSTFLYNISYGFSYITKPFDADNNYYNIVIGSHANVFLKISLGYNAEIGNWTVKPYFSFIHYSNGSFHKPNLGINILNIGIQSGFPVKKQYCIPYQGPITDHKGSYNASVIAGVGFHQKDPPLSPLYPAYTIRFEGERIYSRRHSWGAGLDWCHDRAILFQTDYPEHNPSRAGLYLHFNSFYSRFTFSAQSGYYLYDQYRQDAPVFTRLGLTYRVYKKIRVGVFLKSHFFVADNIEWVIRYSINEE